MGYAAIVNEKRKTNAELKSPYRMVKTKYGKVRGEHRHVMEQHLGRRLPPSEHVHHKNLNRLDNNIGNLEVMAPSDHARLHQRASLWPLALVRQIESDLLSGIPMRDVEKKYSKTRHQIRRQLARQGVHARSVHPFNKAREFADAVEAYFRGETPDSIVKRTGLSHGNLYKYLASDPRYSPRLHAVSDTLRSEMVRLRQSGMSAIKIAKQLNCHVTTVHRNIKSASRP